MIRSYLIGVRVFAAAALVGLALAVSGCAGAFDQANNFFDEVREKGTEVSDKVLDEAAFSFDLYCDKTPDAVRGFLRSEMNERTVKYDAADFCVPKGAPQPEADPARAPPD